MPLQMGTRVPHPCQRVMHVVYDDLLVLANES